MSVLSFRVEVELENRTHLSHLVQPFLLYSPYVIRSMTFLLRVSSKASVMTCIPALLGTTTLWMVFLTRFFSCDSSWAGADEEDDADAFAFA